MKNVVNSRYGIVFQYVLIALWGMQLLYTSAYYVNYLLLLILTGISCYMNYIAHEYVLDLNKGRFCEIVIYLFSILFSLMVSFSNYEIWALTEIPKDYGYMFKDMYNVLVTIVFFAGSFIAFWNLFNAVFSNINRLIWKENDDHKTKPLMIFILSFGLLVLTRVIVLFCFQYPGEITPDSISQIKQSLNGSYSNRHPFYHTLVIKAFISLGLHLFNDINAAIAVYCLFQILFIAMCFSLAVSTMAWMKTPRWMIVMTMVFYTLMPYHILYAITIWKDVMFGGFALLFVIFCFRCMNGIGNSFIAYGMLTLSGLGICLFRSNGFFAFVILTAAFLALWKSKNIRIFAVLVSVIILSFVLKHIVLAGFDIKQPDTIEALSIPAQQIARVVNDGCKLNDWERETLNEIIELERINEEYRPYIADPIKMLVREKGNQHLITDEKGKYLKLYLTLGLKHPSSYIKGWIDETRGYWNAGYEYWIWSYEVWENDLGLERTVTNKSLDRIFREYMWLFTNVQAFRLFLSIGLFVWTDLLMLMIALLRKDKIGTFAALPIVVIVVSLLVATPVFSEFRYIYAAFCALPIVTAIVLRPNEGNVI